MEPLPLPLRKAALRVVRGPVAAPARARRSGSSALVAWALVVGFLAGYAIAAGTLPSIDRSVLCGLASAP